MKLNAKQKGGVIRADSVVCKIEAKTRPQQLTMEQLEGKNMHLSKTVMSPIHESTQKRK